MPWPLIQAAFAALKFLFVSGPAWVTTASWFVASFAIQAALAASTKSGRKGETAQLGPQTTQGEGPVQLVYGENRCCARVLAHHVRVTSTTVVMKPDLPFHEIPVVVATKYARYVIASFGEGPWPEEPDPDTLRVNGRPMSDYPGMTAEWRLGTVDQAALTDWSEFRQDYEVGQEVIYGYGDAGPTPVTFTLNSTGWTDIEVHLTWPQGSFRMGDEGIAWYDQGVKIEVGDAIEDTWHTLMEDTLHLECQDPIRLAYRASETYTGGSPFTVTPAMRPRVRVTRTTPNVRASRYVGDPFNLTAVSVFRPIAFTRPGLVLCAFSVMPHETTTGGIQEISVVSTGKVVADGAGGYAVTRYHADVIRDLLTAPVIEGDGDATPYSHAYERGVPTANLIAAGFDAHKALSDVDANDQAGGTEPLLRCDVILESGSSVHSEIGRIAASGRCGIRYEGNEFGLWLESRGRVPVGILCDGSWLPGSVRWEPIRRDRLASEFIVRYRDAAEDWKETPLYMPGENGETTVSANLDLPALTRAGDAQRLIVREQYRNAHTDLQGQCVTDIYGMVYDQHDVVYVQIQGRSQGGHVAAVDGSTLTLTMAVDAVATGDDILFVQTRDPATGVQSVQQYVVLRTDDATHVTIVGSFSPAPAVEDLFLFGGSAIVADQFELLADAMVDDKLNCTLVYRRHLPEIDNLDL